MGKIKTDICVTNKKATFDYELLDKYQAGIVLKGTEIKSLREKKGSLVDAFCYFDGSELWAKGVNIPKYFYGTYSNHDPLRDRKLLLTKKELKKLENDVKKPGYSIIPINIFISESGYAKMTIALAKGKKQFDKRQSIKDKDAARSIDRAMKDRS